MKYSQTLDKARQAISSGDKATARSILKAVISTDPNNESALMLFVQVAEKPEHAQYCLERVLQINPNNAQAAKWLETLNAQPIKHVTPPPTPRPQTSYTPVAEPPATSVVAGMGKFTKKQKAITGIITSGLAIVCGICLCVIAVATFASQQQDETGKATATAIAHVAGTKTQPASQPTVPSNQITLSTATYTPGVEPTQTIVIADTPALTGEQVGVVFAVIDGDTIDVTIDGLSQGNSNSWKIFWQLKRQTWANYPSLFRR